MTNQKTKQKIDGILLVNKPQGYTSNAILQRVKHLFGAEKAGHTGSLDPLATGMLPICFGEATKFCQYLLDADKTYLTTGLLGIRTNTADSTGEVIERADHVDVSKTALHSACELFLGTTQQLPSMFSALKVNGKPLYRFARAGIEIERSTRPITIHELTVLAFDGLQFQLEVRCSKGTYIRNLVEDIGQQLGVGAHVTELHRLHTAGFQDESMFTLDDLNQMDVETRMNQLLPPWRAVVHFPHFDLTEEEAQQLRHGQVVNTTQSPSISSLVRLHLDQAFIGLGSWETDGTLRVKRLLSSKA